jgi:hypothetical protein
VLLQPGEVPAHPEEVVALGAFLRLPLVVLAEVVLHVAPSQEAFASDAVEALVLLEVDLAGVVQRAQDCLNRAHVIGIGGPYEAVVGESEFLPGPAKRRRVLVGDLLWGHAPLLCNLGDLLPVLVGPGEEEGLFPRQAVVAGERVR